MLDAPGHSGTYNPKPIWRNTGTFNRKRGRTIMKMGIIIGNHPIMMVSGRFNEEHTDPKEDMDKEVYSQVASGGTAVNSTM